MSEKTFDGLLTVVLLLFGAWYLVTMASYPSRAGLVPALVAVVFIGALALHLIGSLRRKSGAAPAPPGDGAALDVESLGEGLDVDEKDSYETLLHVQGVRRRRLLTIVGWTALYYLGAVLVGFVVTTPALVLALLVLLRERLVVALALAAASLVAAYLLVVVVLDQPTISGVLGG